MSVLRSSCAPLPPPGGAVGLLSPPQAAKTPGTKAIVPPSPRSRMNDLRVDTPQRSSGRSIVTERLCSDIRSLHRVPAAFASRARAGPDDASLSTQLALGFAARYRDATLGHSHDLRPTAAIESAGRACMLRASLFLIVEQMEAQWYLWTRIPSRPGR